ncbi:MAG TPA: hypothetical protein VM554_01850 [Acidisarcina sp.]|nr:hypothetical protein [Acidisarcina sp.]
MEADWSVEIGEDLPRIVVPWAAEGRRFCDLRSHPEDAATLPEAQSYPVLCQALMDLNAPSSRIFTSKCDVWQVGEGDLDWMEMESTVEDTKIGLTCYIDLVRRNELAFAPFSQQEEWLRNVTAALQAVPTRFARADLILRQLISHGDDGKDRDGFAATFYLTGCGRDEKAALHNWEMALAAGVPVLIRAA